MITGFYCWWSHQTHSYSLSTLLVQTSLPDMAEYNSENVNENDSENHDGANNINNDETLVQHLLDS